jgi:hypothetical protein
MCSQPEAWPYLAGVMVGSWLTGPDGGMGEPTPGVGRAEFAPLSGEGVWTGERACTGSGEPIVEGTPPTGPGVGIRKVAGGAEGPPFPTPAPYKPS